MTPAPVSAASSVSGEGGRKRGSTEVGQALATTLDSMVTTSFMTGLEYWMAANVHPVEVGVFGSR